MLKTWEKYGFIWVAHANVPELALPRFHAPGLRVRGRIHPSRSGRRCRWCSTTSARSSTPSRSTFSWGRVASHPTRSCFSSETREDETIGRSSSRYRGFPLKLHRLVGIRDGDNYHIDWVFRFKPLHGSYHNYLTDPISAARRPVSYIVTTFFVPVRDKEVDVHTFVQWPSRILGCGGLLRSFAWARWRSPVRDQERCGHRALCPESSDGRQWNLTHLDKQLFVNRRMMDRIYRLRRRRTWLPPTAAS